MVFSVPGNAAQRPVSVLRRLAGGDASRGPRGEFFAGHCETDPTVLTRRPSSRPQPVARMSVANAGLPPATMAPGYRNAHPGYLLRLWHPDIATLNGPMPCGCHA